MNSKRALIVDKEEMLRAMLKHSFKVLKLPYQVVTAANDSEALAQLRRQSFDLALVGYRMPGTNGLSLAQSMRQLLPEIRIILITGYPPSELGEAVEQMTVDGYLCKPFTLKQLVTVIEQNGEEKTQQ